MKKILFFCIITMLMLAGCYKKTDWSLKSYDTGLIVVDGIITDTLGAQKITITRPTGQLNETPPPVTGANVVITCEDSAYVLTEQPANSGIYLTKNTFSAGTGKHYTLLIVLNNRLYTATTYMVPGIHFNALKYAKDEGDPLYHIDSIAEAFNTSDTAMWEVLLDWSHVPGYENMDRSKTTARLLYYTLPTLDVSQIFAPPMESVTFPGGTIVLERRYSLTPEYAAFLRTLIMETNWMGGLFSSVPANVLTNLSPGAVGFFADMFHHFHRYHRRAIRTSIKFPEKIEIHIRVKPGLSVLFPKVT